MAELTVDTCALRGVSQDVWALAHQVGQASEGIDGPAAAGLSGVTSAVSAVPLGFGADRLREVLVSLSWGLQLLSAGLEQSARWYEAAELHAQQVAQATGVPQAPLYGPPSPGPVDELQSLAPVYGPPSGVNP